MPNWVIPTIAILLAIGFCASQAKPDLFSKVFNTNNLPGFFFVVGLALMATGGTFDKEEAAKLGILARILLNICCAGGLGLIVTGVVTYARRCCNDKDYNDD